MGYLNKTIYHSKLTRVTQPLICQSLGQTKSSIESPSIKISSITTYWTKKDPHFLLIFFPYHPKFEAPTLWIGPRQNPSQTQKEISCLKTVRR